MWGVQMAEEVDAEKAGDKACARGRRDRTSEM